MGKVVVLKTLTDDPAVLTKFYVAEIRTALGKSVEGFIEAGRVLAIAKSKLKHGEFLTMLPTIPLEPTQAQVLMKIAGHTVLSNAVHAQHLPPSWTTLYELTKLPGPLIEAKIKEGVITPKTERKQVMELRAENGLAPKPRAGKFTPPAKSAAKSIPAKTTAKLATDAAIDAAINTFVAAIAGKTFEQRLVIFEEAIERSGVNASMINDIAWKRAKAEGRVDFIALSSAAPIKKGTKR